MKITPIKSLILLTALIAAGCSTTDKDAPKHMSRVECVQYDSTARPMKPSVEVFDKAPDRKYKVIALITCEGTYREEAAMMKPIIYKARQLGADGIIRIDANQMQAGRRGGRCLYKADAIVFE